MDAPTAAEPGRAGAPPPFALNQAGHLSVLAVPAPTTGSKASTAAGRRGDSAGAAHSSGTSIGMAADDANASAVTAGRGDKQLSSKHTQACEVETSLDSGYKNVSEAEVETSPDSGYTNVAEDEITGHCVHKCFRSREITGQWVRKYFRS